MFQPLFTRLQKEDLGAGAPAWSDKLIYPINQMADYLKTAFARQISFSENMQNPLRTFTIVAGTTPQSNTITFAISLPTGQQPVGAVILNCIDLSGSIVGAAVWSEMQPGLTNGGITIRAIYGLTAAHTYSITWLVF